ncbi:unnamed protein product [Phytophthora lilii]|uniref:Unnamed protein product n=1 Tax=Phytophthora lilii TaxID=2077276 RepID=A0A9W6TY92_9STRA|nr:unnamed protein product [Phytophthora lilii]
MELFFTEVSRPVPANGVEEEADPPTLFRCRCGKTRAQRLKHGYTNLVQHVLVKHADWAAAAAREAHPSPAPALANGGEASTSKRNGKARAEAESEEKADVDGNDNVSADSSEEKQPAATKEEKAPPSAVQKRSDYLSWDDYFMSVAFLSAMRSKG